MTARGGVTERIRQDILAGELAPGSRLVEIDLTSRYGVGRAAVRSALVELEKEGLVDRTANRGALVHRVTLEETIEITEARAELEGLVARYAARRATAQERSELQELVEKMRLAVSEADALGYSELNRTLHRRLLEIGRHEVARSLITNLRNRAAHQQYRIALMPGRPRESLRQHEALVEAVVAGDDAEAEKAMHRHLESVIVVLREWVAAGARS